MKKVIIVDDEKHCIIDLQKSISWETFGYEVKETFQIAEEAEKAIICSSPDIVFTDVKMPKLNGLELIKRLRQGGYKNDIVVVSGYDEFDYAKKAMAYNVADYCLKPIREKEINSVLIKLNKKDKNLEVIKLLPNEILDYLNSNVHKKVTLEDICNKFNISTATCTKLFKDNFGKTFKQLVQEIQMERAMQLLLETDFSIQKIASIVGEEDYFYFTKKFKNVTGVTPTKYRKNG
ncbi:MAG: response regulator [Lachnospirales bacterium]